MKISKELYTFFKEWLEWAENGGKGVKFSNRVGLCANFAPLAFYEKELENLFGENAYPFGEKDYRQRLKNATQHLCPKRLAFVREQIALYESYVENE